MQAAAVEARNTGIPNRLLLNTPQLNDNFTVSTPQGYTVKENSNENMNIESVGGVNFDNAIDKSSDEVRHDTYQRLETAISEVNRLQMELSVSHQRHSTLKSVCNELVNKYRITIDAQVNLNQNSKNIVLAC